MAGEIITYFSQTGGIDEQGQRNYSRVFLVGNTAHDAHPDLVDALVGIVWGDQHPDDSLAFCKRKTVRMVEKGSWEATYEYDSKTHDTNKGSTAPGGLTAAPSSPNTNAQNTAPESRPWTVTYDSVTAEEHLLKDRHVDGSFNADPRDVVNAAGLPFESGLQVPVSRCKINIKSYRAVGGGFSPPVHVLTYVNKVNSATYLGFAAKTVRVDAVKFATQYEHGAWFFEQDTTLEIKLDGWNPTKLANVSTMVKPSMIGRYKPIIDPITGQAVTTPVPISADGTRALNSDEAIIYLEFDAYYTYPLTSLI